MKSRSNTRGFTLVELSIVMALVAILAVMIVSFTSLTSLRVRQATARTDFIDAVADYRAGVTDGFALIDEKNAVFIVSADGASLTVGQKDFPCPDGIDRVTAETNENGTLLRVTLTNDSLSLTESFVIASHCGATFGIGGGS